MILTMTIIILKCLSSEVRIFPLCTKIHLKEKLNSHINSHCLVYCYTLCLKSQAKCNLLFPRKKTKHSLDNNKMAVTFLIKLS